MKTTPYPGNDHRRSEGQTMADEQQVAALRQGKDAWNAWRQQNPGVTPDLRGAVFVRDRASPDLRGADLSHAKLRDTSFAFAHLTGADLIAADLTNAKLVGTYLDHAHLTDANLTCARLIEADLSGAYLHRAELYGANLMYAKLAGADLTAASLVYAHFQGGNFPVATSLVWASPLLTSPMPSSMTPSSRTSTSRKRGACIPASMRVQASWTTAPFSDQAHSR
jgi:uncharacterized protein YjbI with pentapeptide repeats